MPPAANYCLTPDQYHLSSYSNFTSSSSIENFGKNIPNHHPIPMVNHLSLSCNNSISSTSSDQESHEMIMIIKDRKRRRMVSNRESARRSRMRKQSQLQELCTQVMWLRDQNHGLVDRINRYLESQRQVVEENDKLKKETLELRKLLSEAQLATTYNGLGDIGFLRDLDEVDDAYDFSSTSCTTAHLRAQSSTTNDSSTLLH